LRGSRVGCCTAAALLPLLLAFHPLLRGLLLTLHPFRLPGLLLNGLLLPQGVLTLPLLHLHLLRLLVARRLFALCLLGAFLVLSCPLQLLRLLRTLLHLLARVALCALPLDLHLWRGLSLLRGLRLPRATLQPRFVRLPELGATAVAEVCA
jgi:hypothetical protein